MPIYEYKALTQGGQVKTGILDADTPRDARTKLRKDNIHVTSIRPLHDVTKAEATGTATRRPRFSLRLPRRRESVSVMANFTRQFATLLKAGTPLAECLQVLISQAPSRRFEAVLRDVRERVTGGDTLAEAFDNHPAAFNALYVNMVRAGEASGRLDTVLFRISEYLHAQNRIRNKVASAMMYPIIMVSVGVIVVTVLMQFVVPKILKLVASQRAVLPLPTLILKRTSEFLQDYWILLAVCVAGLLMLLSGIRRTEKGRYAIDKFKLGLPIIGDLYCKQAVSRFAITLSTLLRSGVPVLEALKIVQHVVDNAVMAEVVALVHDRIVEGTDISTPLRKSKLFPPVVGHMIAVGEQSGQLEDILTQLAESYDEEIEIATQRMTAVLEPVLIICMAFVVAFIVLSIVLPMLRLGTSAGR